MRRSGAGAAVVGWMGEAGIEWGSQGGEALVGPSPHAAPARTDLVVVERDALRARIRAVLAAFPEVAGAYLFGSALGTVRPGSDIDLGVIPTVDLTPQRGIDLGAELEERLGHLGSHPFHVTILRQRNNAFTFAVLRDGHRSHRSGRPGVR